MANKRQDLMRKAQQYQNAVRKKLEQIAQVGRGNGRWMDPSGATQSFNAASFGLPGPSHNSAAQVLRHGQTITDADVQEFIRRTGGNRFLNELKTLDSKKKVSSGRPTGRMSSSVTREVNQNTMLQDLFADAQYKADLANAENLRRFDYGIDNLENLRDRNQERVQNFGKAAKADLEERFSQNLGDVTANLSGRGLGNSTILSAFEAKNARDLAREQQRLSEMVDDRASRYDSSDTQNAVSFAERRNDVGPDFSALAQLAQAYGASGASGGETPALQTLGTMSGGGQREEAQAVPLQFGMNLPYATSAWNARNIAGSYQGAYGNPLTAQSNAMASVVGQPYSQPAMGSNRYPVVKPRPPMGYDTALKKAARMKGSGFGAQDASIFPDYFTV